MHKTFKMRLEIHLGAILGAVAQIHLSHLRNYKSRCIASVPSHLKLDLCWHRTIIVRKCIFENKHSVSIELLETENCPHSWRSKVVKKAVQNRPKMD